MLSTLGVSDLAVWLHTGRWQGLQVLVRWRVRYWTVVEWRWLWWPIACCTASRGGQAFDWVGWLYRWQAQWRAVWQWAQQSALEQQMAVHTRTVVVEVQRWRRRQRVEVDSSTMEWQHWVQSGVRSMRWAQGQAVGVQWQSVVGSTRLVAVDSEDRSRQELMRVAVQEDSRRALLQAAVHNAGQSDKDRSKQRKALVVAELSVEVDKLRQAEAGRLRVKVADSRVAECVCHILSYSRLCPCQTRLVSHRIHHTSHGQAILHVHLVHTAPQRGAVTAASLLDRTLPVPSLVEC